MMERKEEDKKGWIDRRKNMEEKKDKRKYILYH